MIAPVIVAAALAAGAAPDARPTLTDEALLRELAPKVDGLVELVRDHYAGEGERHVRLVRPPRSLV